MQTTTNLNLKKPEPGDYALVSDINDNMDTLDTKIADVRDSNVSFTDSDLDSGITDFPSFLTKVVSGMKLAKFLRDFKAGMGYVLHTGSLINNATCTESGKALDARMGKTLQDQITSLNDSLANKSAFFGSQTSFILASAQQYSSLESAISDILPSGDGVAAYIRSFKYNSQITSPVAANQSWVFGWMNSNGTYGWYFLLTYTGCFYGTRHNSTQTVWHALY